ncbi:hypothetical protein PRK78_006243 [Emydomyces testavorans]|uniref:Uncharacterized protein n=1 Tax=Emydomyces testavorans TaxID=2070801 RepID=A0AAF0DPW0_9EURO|nr:hypothetical protein PRK78_006243 [Emydomyces testavorans]
MAPTNPGRLSPLKNGSDLTNHLRCQSLIEGASTSPSRLRRTVSIRAVNAHLDSSESIPSEHSSLCNGLLTSFDRCDEETPPEKGKGADTVEGKGLRERCSSVSRAGWRAHTLETICEHPSVSTLKTSASPLPRNLLRAGGISLRIRTSSGSLLPGNRYGSKIYSLDDLDIPSFRPKFSFSSLPAELRRSARFSSSTWSFQDHHWLSERPSPVEPIHPIYPPPVRCATPPGLPSFGSPEAVRFRLPSQASQPVQRPANDGGGDDCTCCLFGLRQLLGVSPCAAPRPLPVPTGAVARADDGTIVRGRFGTRQSGHGVGAGPSGGGLANHPFHRESLPVACIQDIKRNEMANEDGRQTSLCCGDANSASPAPQCLPRTSSLRSSLASRPSSTYPAPRRVHFVDGTAPDNATPSVPVPSYIRHPPLVPPAPIAETASPGRNSTTTDATAEVTGSASTRVSRSANARTQASVGPVAPSAAIPSMNNSGGTWEHSSVVSWFAECCGLWMAYRLNQNGGAGTGDGANVDVKRWSHLNSIREYWTRGRNVSRPWIPAWGCQPVSSG